MRKLTLFFTTLFLSVGMAWAQTATLEKSTNVENPEFLYELKNANNVWMASNTAPTQNNIASFAFFGTANADFYKIYSFDKKQWVSYDKSNNYDNCKDFVKFADSQDAANAWKITQATNGNAVYQIQPQNSDGSVSDKYMNWNGGVDSWGYSYDDTRTVGLWEDNASTDRGSAWILSEKVVSLSDATKFVNGDIYTFVTERGWMGAKADNDYVVSTVYTGNNIPAADVKRTNPYFQWTVYKSDNDKYYLYNIGKGQFMGVKSTNNTPVPFVATPAGLGLTFKKSSNANYPIMFSTDNKAVVNHSGNHQYGLISWTGGWNTLNDGGSNHKVVKVGELDDATLSTIEELVANYEETAILKMPEAGKYYRIMAVEGWNDDARYLGSKNSTANTSRAEFVAEADAHTIFYFDGNYLKSFASGEYLVSSSDRMLGYNGNQTNGASISFCAASNGLVGAYNIGFNNSTRWLYVNQSNYTDAGGTRNNANGYCFNIVEVTELPVAQIGNTVYYTLADAKANVKAGETLTLFVDTDETIELPLGVILDKNGHTADNVTVATPVAMIGETAYASLAAAVKAASAGAKITFVDNVNENVTLSKNVTIDGANFNYTGTMSANNALTVTVQNVHFVNGGFSKNNSGTSGTYTIKDCTFDGQGKYAYPVVAKNIGTLNVENCTVKDYQYGFLYVKQQSTKVSVKNVTVENCANYAVYLASGVAATIENLSVKNSNNGILWPSAGARTLNLSGCKFENVKTAINSNGGAYVVTANIHGVNNDFGTAVLSDNVKCVLAEDATLAATTAGLNVTTNIEGKEVAYQGGKYSVVLKRDPAGQVAYRADVTDKEDREGIAILLKDPYAKNSLVVKVYNGETLMFTCTRRDIDDEGKVMFPVTANTTANIVLWGKESGSWTNEIHVAPTELNVPNKVEVYADGVLTDSYTHETGTVLGTNLEKYLALDCVKKFAAKIGNVGYETLDAALAAAEADETVTLLRDVTASEIITINKAITLDGNDKTLTSTAARAFNIETEGKVVISNLTVNAGERAFNIINKPATVELNDVTATASNNAVMIATSAGAANVTINGCDFTGLAVVNVAGAGAQVAINDTKITNIDANEAENYGAITVYSTATNAKVTVNGGSITVADDSKQAYIFAEGATVTGVDQIGQIVAMIGEAGYETLTEAIADAKEGQTVKMVYDVTGAGVVIDKSITIDFNGKTYTANAGVGSAGTQTLALQILKENNVTLKNGTLTSEGENIKMLINNYANLTVDNMKLVDATDAIQYVLSNNSGEVNIINGSEITANGAIALDACKYASYAAPTVNVAEGVTVNGNVEVSATLNMNGTLNGAIVINGAEGKVNGVEGLNVTAMDGYNVAYADGAYTIVEKHYVAQVGGVQYETFAAAVAAAPAGGTVTLIDNATESATVVLTKNLTIDGAGKTFTGAIEFKKSNGTFTVKNVNFNGAGNRVYALKSQSSTTNLTVEGCTATGYTYGFLYANSAIANVTVTDVTVKDVNYGVHSARGTNVTLNNFVAENVKYGVMVQNYSGRNVVLNNCSFTGSENPLNIWERNQTYKITFNFKGVNEMGKADFCTGASAMAVVNADAIVGTKVCGTLADAVEAAEADETVALLRNVQPESYVTIDKSITLDLGEYNITREGTALYVNGDVEVAINGTGTVTGKQALYVANGLAKVYGGNFCGVAEAVYVQNTGKAEIYGGTFSSSETSNFVLNKKDADREATDITVYGGTFVGFNPADNAAEGEGTNFVAEGYVVVDNGDGTYTVEKNPAYGKVAKVGEEYYATLTEALAAAAAGTTVELIADVNEDVTLTKNVTINGANFKYTGTMSANANITVNVLDLNFVNAGFSKGTKSTNGNYTFKGCTFDGQGTYSRAIYVRGANKVVLENCTATGYDYFMYVPNALNNSVTVKNVTIENCSGYAVMFNSGAGKATFENFTVKNTPTAIIYNNSANRALTLNNCTMENVDTAIKHTGNGDKNITCTFVGKNNLGGAFSEYVVLQNAALAGTTIYASLAEAVAADGNEVKLLGNSTGAGVVIDKDLTIDFNGNTYTFTEGVGSTGTESNGFQILKDNDVVLKNGTLNVAAASASKFYTIIQNYATLTVEDMNLDGTNLDKWSTTDGDSYVFSNNNANVVIKGNTNITANNDGDKAFAFDADKAANVTVETTGTIAGKIEKAADATITIYSGTYTMDVNEWCAEGYAATKIADNMWTVGKAIAQVDEVKYASIQAAIDAAQDGETVKMLDNVTLDTKTLATQNDGYAVLVNVNGKKVTIDLNGKTITVNAAAADLAAAKGKMLLTVFHADTNGELTLTDNTADKAGAVVVNVNDATVYSVFASESQYSDKSESGKLTVNAGNYKTVGKIANAMFFTDANEVITVNGGNFHCDGATTNAPYPWMFNTYLNNVIHVTVNGGTFNVDVNHQHRPFEVYVPETFAVNANGDGTWTVVPAVAYITEKLGDTVHESGDLEHKVGYTTLAAAVEAAVEGDYVTLLKSVTGAGLVINKGLTIDFGGNTYSFNEGVGSTGTASNGFQILKGNEVTLKNGTLNVAEAAKGEFYILVQNYANLTVADMNLDGTNLDKYSATDGDSYVLSNNSGEVVITGETNITANDEGDKAFAFDACDKTAWGYTLPVVNVETTGKIEGLIESTATIAISGGTFTTPIADEWCAEYYVPVQNADGTYGVEKRYIETLEIDDDKYFAGDMPAEGFVNKNEQTVGTLTYKRTFKKANLWQALYVPFEIPVASLNDLGYEVAYLYDVHNKVVDGEVIDPADIESVHFVKIKKGTLKASYPYIIRPTSEADLNLSLTLYDAKLYSTDKKNDVESSTTTTRYIFTGTYADAYSTDITGDANIPCARINANGNWQKMTTTAILVPFRICMYIVNKDGSPVIMSDEAAKSIKIRIVGEENEDETTGIKFYEFDTEQASDYIYDLHGRRVLEPQKGSIYIVNGKKVIF